MIYVRGDIHGNFFEIIQNRIINKKALVQNDYLIICGDFGIWDNSTSENKWLDRLSKLSFKILFVDGNHENFDILNRLPVHEWNGGKIHKIRENIFHLMRGQVFTIEGKKFFTIGGASSHDISAGILELNDPDFDQKYYMLRKRNAHFRVNHSSWWKEELPSDDEYKEATVNLDKHNWNVDVILSHCGPNSIGKKIPGLEINYRCDRLTDFLEEVMNKCKYKVWFMGHYHRDLTLLANSITEENLLNALDGQECSYPAIHQVLYKGIKCLDEMI